MKSLGVRLHNASLRRLGDKRQRTRSIARRKNSGDRPCSRHSEAAVGEHGQTPAGTGGVQAGVPGNCPCWGAATSVAVTDQAQPSPPPARPGGVRACETGDKNMPLVAEEGGGPLIREPYTLGQFPSPSQSSLVCRGFYYNRRLIFYVTFRKSQC